MSETFRRGFILVNDPAHSLKREREPLQAAQGASAPHKACWGCFCARQYTVALGSIMFLNDLHGPVVPRVVMLFVCFVTSTDNLSHANIFLPGDDILIIMRFLSQLVTA